MRLVVLSMALPLVLAVTGCAGSDVESLASEPASADDAEAVHAAEAGDIKEKGTDVITAIFGLMKLDVQWNKRIKGGATTEAARREIRDMVGKMRATLDTLPAEAEWVSGYVRHDADAIKAGFAGALASEPARAHLGAEKIRALKEAVDRAGGVDAIILRSAKVVRDHAHEVGEGLGRGEKIPVSFVCGLVGTIAGANAAREDWVGVAGPLSAMLAGHCIQ